MVLSPRYQLPHLENGHHSNFMRFVVKVKQGMSSPMPSALLSLVSLSSSLLCPPQGPGECSRHRGSEDAYWPSRTETTFWKTVACPSPNCEVGPVFRATAPHFALLDCFSQNCAACSELFSCPSSSLEPDHSSSSHLLCAQVSTD